MDKDICIKGMTDVIENWKVMQVVSGSEVRVSKNMFGGNWDFYKGSNPNIWFAVHYLYESIMIKIASYGFSNSKFENLCSNLECKNHNCSELGRSFHQIEIYDLEEFNKFFIALENLNKSE